MKNCKTPSAGGLVLRPSIFIRGLPNGALRKFCLLSGLFSANAQGDLLILSLLYAQESSLAKL